MGDIVQIGKLRLLKHKFIVWSEWGDQRPKKWDDPHFSVYDYFCVGLVVTLGMIVGLILVWLFLTWFR